jgi:hypothetical protein
MTAAAVQENSPAPSPSPVTGSKYSRMPPSPTRRSVVRSSSSASAASPCCRSPRASSQLRFAQIGPRQYAVARVSRAA